MGKIIVTLGDASGIGAEIILKSFNKISDVSNFVLIGNRKIFEINEEICGIKLPQTLDFINIDFDYTKIKKGIENKYSGELAYLSLKKACDLVNEGFADKIATAPLSKNALHMAGHNYSGQTEILQQELALKNNQAQMLFLADKLKILLLTRHEALSNVPKKITKENIISVTKILNSELKSKFYIKNPVIAMTALNPHAGENGILGREELDVINPALKILNEQNINIKGAFSADTLIGNAVKNYTNPAYDAYIACYHDQALTAIKSLGLDKVLNITIGLKALRVSPSHGTAFDIAYQNKADYKSMLNSILFLQNI